MNVLLVSECDKRALIETRRILDQFAERRGERTWQTAITMEGLNTLRRLLRKTARKNTAVACHWIRGRDHTELMWIVGDARRFNAEGAVPTNTTVRDVLRAHDENDWHTAHTVRLLALLAALLHDLGKASLAFQERLRGKRSERNFIRHEWLSLRMFLAFVGEDDDLGWLTRLAGEEAMDEGRWTVPERDRLDLNGRPFAALVERAPLAAAIGWLIVTHHRLPTIPPTSDETARQVWGIKRSSCFEKSWLVNPLAAITCQWNEVIAPGTPMTVLEPYWRCAGPLPVSDPAWHKRAARAARSLIRVCQQGARDWIENVWRLHLARLCLMLADHHYSCLNVIRDDERGGQPVSAREPFLPPELRRRVAQWSDAHLWANTWRDRHGKPCPNQSLLEHLCAVGAGASEIAHALPSFERQMPRLARHRGLRRRSEDARFAWQDRAFDAAETMREVAREHGAFIIDMASTGCGKTLANARILYALADPQRGMRASVALGLRTLTLQTGQSYRHDLHLEEDDLAILVGGAASQVLFEFHQQKAEETGSASVRSLLEEEGYVRYEGDVADHPLVSRALADGDIRRVLSAPLLVCTVDHLVPASESLRAGRQIAPLLRLMSADLVLDELDDYDMNDLPALTRLVFFAGMAGARVLLSSATLPPALVRGMFRAYQAGRRQYRCNRGSMSLPPDAPAEVPCFWVDEFGKPQVERCKDAASFASAHDRFVEQRIGKLVQQAPLRIGRLQQLVAAGGMKREPLCAHFATQVWQVGHQLHQAHAQADPVTGARVSFGLVRMVHIDTLIDVAKALISTPTPEGLKLHLCVYHARFPLQQRSSIEALLDAVLDRRDDTSVWRHPSVRQAVDAAPGSDHVFLVLASPVCEVGRDWDADWAIAEPSSMRSVIQLAGRVQRHRRRCPAEPNVVIFDTNLRAVTRPNQAAFVRPGFEKEEREDRERRFLLATHRLAMLRADSQQDGFRGERIDAVPRIRAFPDAVARARDHWVALEHGRMEVAMEPIADQDLQTLRTATGRVRSPAWSGVDRDRTCVAWQFPATTLLGALPQEQPFREDNYPERTLVFLPDEDEETLVPHRDEPRLEKLGQEPYVPASEMVSEIELQPAGGVSPWGVMDLPQLLERVRELAETEEISLRDAAIKFTPVQVRHEGDNDRGWQWHPWLGFM